VFFSCEGDKRNGNLINNIAESKHGVRRVGLSSAKTFRATITFRSVFSTGNSRKQERVSNETMSLKLAHITAPSQRAQQIALETTLH